MWLKTLYFLALILTALAMSAAMAHFFELPNKIDISGEHYLIVQRNYDNWHVIGLVVPAAFLSVVALTIGLRRAGAPFNLALIALLLLVAELAVFWMLTAPVNRATASWTMLPDNWEQLRSQWEYSHAARALLYLLALGALIMSVLDWRTERVRGVGAKHRAAI